MGKGLPRAVNNSAATTYYMCGPSCGRVGLEPGCPGESPGSPETGEAPIRQDATRGTRRAFPSALGGDAREIPGAFDEEQRRGRDAALVECGQTFTTGREGLRRPTLRLY